MMIDCMPDVLAWEDDGPETWVAVHDGYQALLADRLGAALARTGRLAPARTEALRQAIPQLSDTALQRFLLAPETACRLLWPLAHETAEILDFLEGAVETERRLQHGAVTSATPRWSALGDARAGEQGAEWQARIAGLPPLDLLSPHALGVDLEGELLRLPSPRAAQAAEERDLIIDRLGQVAEALTQLGPEWALFLRTFTKVLVLQPDHDAPQSFSSGTSGQYPGRSVIANAHLPTVTLEVIVDGLVHESIHGLLYMQEQQRPWVLADALYGGARVMTSPWTGTKLPLRPYMQAAFVWYGLLHFWSRAMEAGVFDPGRARQRLRLAAEGFLKTPLVDQLRPYRDQLSPELPTAIAEMQRRVQVNLEAAVNA